MSNNLIHFETLWELSEQQSQNKYSNSAEILAKISTKLQEIINIHQVHLQHPQSEIAVPLKTEHFGQLMFLLTAFSYREKIDVYSALKKHLETLQFENMLQTIVPEFKLPPSLEVSS